MLEGVFVVPNGVAFIVGRLKLGIFRVGAAVVEAVVLLAPNGWEEGLLAPKEEAVFLFPKGAA